MYILLVAVFTSCAGLVFGQSLTCLSANGRSKECVPFSECEPLRALAKKTEKTEEDINILSRSFCRSINNVPLVCCPEPGPVQTIKSPPRCRTPDGKPGECIKLMSCPHLTKLLRPPPPTEVLDFLQRSVCNGPEEHSVCCGPPPTSSRSKTPPEVENPEDSDKTVDCKAVVTAFPPTRSSGCCGDSVGVGSKISGGNATGIDEYPWAVIIEYTLTINLTTTVSCGGALISSKYVLTAAHCIAGSILKVATPNIVRLGEYYLDHEGPDCVPAPGDGLDCTDGAKRIRIEKTIPHPSYVYGKSKRHDIGLIKMREAAPYTDFIRPICLPAKDLTRPENTPPYFTMYAVGWGTTEFGVPSNVKLDVNLPYVTNEKCEAAYNTLGNVSLWNGQLCAGGVAAQDACKGDSGGPLVYEKEEKFELIGLVSFGPDPCGEKGVPGIYTNVYEYLDWIKNVIAQTEQRGVSGSTSSTKRITSNLILFSFLICFLRLK